MTGHASEEAENEAIRHGAFHYYVKPLYHIDAFLRLVDQALESRRLNNIVLPSRNLLKSFSRDVIVEAVDPMFSSS